MCAAGNLFLVYFSRRRRIDLAISFFETVLKSRGDAMSYNILIDAHAKSPDMALYWYEKMLSAQCVPTAETFGTLCKMYSRFGDDLQVREIMDLVEKKNIMCNHYFFASLISAYANAQKPDLAELAFLECVQQRMDYRKLANVLSRSVGDRRAHYLLCAAKKGEFRMLLNC
jgi:pentatricopeptide repeat protein